MSSRSTLFPEVLRKIDAYWRAANYLSVGQIYLYDNPLLREPLTAAHVKPMLLGHWGTTPGQNFIYVHLNRIIKKYDLDGLHPHHRFDVHQHAKWLKVTAKLPWRRKIASLNYLLASHVWRQDHNGFTHQDPGFIDHVVNKKAEIVRVYLPPDANCLLSVIDHCLRSRHYVNVIVAGKHPSPQWLEMEAAVAHCTKGIDIWPWASNDLEAEPDVVMACAGDVPTLETLAAVSILRQHLPHVKVRVLNVVDLMKLQPQSEHPHGLPDAEFDRLFTIDKPIIFAFHAYPWLIHRLTYRRTNHHNLHVRGYKEEGTITTAFDMTVLNDLDRFHLVIDVIDRLPQTGSQGVYLKQQLQNKLIEHRRYITQFGQDMPEVRQWKWGDPQPLDLKASR